MTPVADIATAEDRTHSIPRFDVEKVRADFPILQTQVHGRALVYLDNGATTQKPRRVIDAISRYYEAQNANIHRGVYQLSQLATELYDQGRKVVARFLNVADEKQIIFTRGTTEGINLVAACWGRTFLKAGDEVVVSAMEHHSNIVPWQIACEMTGAKLRVIPMNDAGELLMDEYARLLNGRTKLVSVVHTSNSLGTINDIATITRMAHEVGAMVMVDGAQWVAHHPTDLAALGVDFYAFSGHKIFGPTGIGVLYGRRELLERMPPYQGGGDMIESVTFEKSVYAALPNKFEAGTPDIAGVVGLAAAIEYLQSIGFEGIAAHEQSLLDYATRQLQAIPGLRIIGAAKKKAGVISFVLEKPAIGSMDIGTALDQEGVAVRTGHHCCQPVMDRMKIAATTRASFAMYNTKADVDALVGGIKRIVEKALARTPTAMERPVGEMVFPGAAAESPQAAAVEMAEVLEFLGDNTERTRYIQDDLGTKIPEMPAELKSDLTRVHGCMSVVHLFARKKPGTVDVLEFVADSDAFIVRGLIAVLEKLFSGQRAKDILAFDIDGFFRRIGLESFLSTQRRNGLAGMVARIRREAQGIEGL